MAGEDESLSALINVLADLSDLNDLIDKLVQIELAIDKIDGRRIDLDTKPAQASLAQLQAQMGAQTLFGGGGRDAGIPGMDLDADTADDADNVSRSLRRVSNSAETAADSFSITNLRMSDLHNAVARLVPVILVLIGALPALIGAFVGLAAAAVAATAALVGLAGFGALGFAIQEAGVGNLGEGFEALMGDIRESFLDAFVPLANRIAPLMEDALDGLDRLFQAIANRGDVLVQFGDAARDLGGFILDTFPDFLATVGRIATVFVPVFETLANLIGQQDFGQGFIEFMIAALPSFTQFIALAADLLPHILGLSIGFLKVVNALMMFFSVLFDVITLGGLLNEQIGVTIGVMLTAITVISILNSSLITMALSGIGSAVASMFRFIGSLGSYIVAAKGAIASTSGLAIAMRGLAAAIALTGIGALVVGIGAIASQFVKLGTDISTATDELREFQNLSQSVEDNPFGNAPIPERASLLGRGSGPEITVNVQDSADADTLGQQLSNADFRRKEATR